jgi:hypothetical protein
MGACELVVLRLILSLIWTVHRHGSTVRHEASAPCKKATYISYMTIDSVLLGSADSFAQSKGALANTPSLIGGIMAVGVGGAAGAFPAIRAARAPLASALRGK